MSRPAEFEILQTALSVLLLWLLCCTESAAAHDFWLQPEQFWVGPQALTSLTLQVGHGPDRQRSPIASRRITRFEAIAPNGTAMDLHAHLRVGGKTEDGEFLFPVAGTYVLVLQTDDQAQSFLPAIRFNDYLRTEGLTAALEYRERMHRTNADGSENYSRIAKSIIQVGSSTGVLPASASTPLGLPLEIVPECNPYAEPRPARLRVRVIYEGRPLAGGLVKLTNLEHDAQPVEMQRTDRMGRASFIMPHSGAWLLNVIWTRPLPSSRETDFETVFSSLSFGFPAR